jgi:hypothetical protein
MFKLSVYRYGLYGKSSVFKQFDQGDYFNCFFHLFFVEKPAEILRTQLHRAS